ncbi:MAG TPA: PqqD family protein [Chromatiales bacterium]|nr:PqqD family protein [Chromatiales bacterium]
MTASPPTRRDGIEMRKLGNEWLLYDPRSGIVHIINGTAHLVWELCDGTRNPADIEAALTAAYEVPENADVRKDLEHILQSFLEKDLLVP